MDFVSFSSSSSSSRGSRVLLVKYRTKVSHSSYSSWFGATIAKRIGIRVTVSNIIIPISNVSNELSKLLQAARRLQATGGLQAAGLTKWIQVTLSSGQKLNSVTPIDNVIKKRKLKIIVSKQLCKQVECQWHCVTMKLSPTVHFEDLRRQWMEQRDQIWHRLQTLIYQPSLDLDFDAYATYDMTFPFKDYRNNVGDIICCWHGCREDHCSQRYELVRNGWGSWTGPAIPGGGSVCNVPDMHHRLDQLF